MKAVIPCRVSTKEQEEDGKSLLAQAQRLRDYCKRKKMPILREFHIVESSTRGDRKEFRKMIEFVKAQKEKVAIVADAVDRVQRSFKESVLLDDLRRKGKICIHFVRENLVIDEDSKGSEIMMWDFAVMGAKAYVLSLSDNVKRSVDYKLRNGEWIGRAPVGYLNAKDKMGNSIVVVDKERGYLIQRAFELYSRGTYSIKAIARILEEDGLTNSLPPHNKMVVSQIHMVLRNPFYYGEMLCKGVLYPHKYEPLISRELFDECQKVRESHKKKPFKYAAKPFVLRGLVRCAFCGCSVSFDKKKGKYIYGCCSKYKGDCGAIRVKEQDLLKQIQGIFQSLTIPKYIMTSLRQKLKDGQKAKQRYHKATIANVRCEYDSIQTQLDKLLDLALQESITQDEYDKKASSLKTRQHELDLKLKAHTQADEKFSMAVSYLIELSSRSAELFEVSKVDQKRELINFVLSNLTLKGKKLLFKVKEPFNAIIDANNDSKWLPLVDRFRTELFGSIVGLAAKFEHCSLRLGVDYGV